VAATAFLVEQEGVGLDGLVELLLNTTDSKVLASPELHAVSGQASRLQIGQKLPYRVTTTTQTATLETVQMLDVGVVLEVTPRVTRDGRVLMRIMPKVSDGSISPDTGLPSETTNEVETDILMSSGQGMVLGGLIQEVDSNVQSKLPWLGDIPYLGVLFQKRQVVKSRREIIVTLRPHVLPYSPILQAEQDAKIMRTEAPLTQGAICSYPRPYEPRMPDTFDHYERKKAEWAQKHGGFIAPDDTELMALPPVDSTDGGMVEELPAPEDGGAYPELHNLELPLQ
jgi:type II secretory pathway component GspD/PulD (secretin)